MHHVVPPVLPTAVPAWRVPLLAAILIAFLAARPASAVPAAGESGAADVVVYGATPAGCCAAVAAARESAAVILLEPTAHVGGLCTGGLSFSDSNQTIRSTVRGLFDEWFGRVAADYARRGVRLPYDVAVKDAAHWTCEPHVAARVTREMLDEAGVRVVTDAVLTDVVKDGARIIRLDTRAGGYSGRIFIDATYEGDLMAAAGAGHASGREGRDAFGESLAGRQYPKPVMAIDGLDDAGRPLPLVTDTERGPDDVGDDGVMVFSFRLCLTKDPANRVPFPEPDHYDPARFELVRRYLAQERRPALLWDLYRLPGGKVDANIGIGRQFSLGLVGGSAGWCAADAEERARIFEAHRQYTLEMYRFLTTDPAVPEPLRKRLAELGLCRDEFPETGHFSPALYVREGRRLRGLHVLSQRDILDEPAKDDPVIVSSFPIDSHDCRRIALPGGGVVNEGTIFPVRMQGRPHGYPYHVPFRALLPRPEECDNLLVPVALSATHVAMSSVRVEPTWMILGQSAGIAAALAAVADVPPAALPYPRLRARLLARGQVLDLPDLTNATPAVTEQTLFRSGLDGYHTYRIPSLLVTPAGTVLAFCEGRRASPRDDGDIDLLVKRSTDAGRTWSPQRVVHEEGDDAPITIGNPCPVVDAATGTIVLAFTRDNAAVFVTTSDDDGSTWSPPRDVSASALAEGWDWVATGPGIGIQLRAGPHRGRLVIPCDHRIDHGAARGPDAEWNSHMMLSDDGGATWQLSAPIRTGGNECQVIEGDDGTLLVNTRMQGGFAGWRGIATSADGGATWTAIRADEQLPCPKCQAALLRLRDGRVVFANPRPPTPQDDVPSRDRVDLTIRLSDDGGRTWPHARRLHAGPSAYAALAELDDGTILCLYEGGAAHPREWLRLARFTPAWIEAAP